MRTDLAYARLLDVADPLASYRACFAHPDPGLIYVDGNSLGRLPHDSLALARSVVEYQWGERLIRSWNEGWFDAPERVGAKIAALIGAQPDEVIVAVSTSVNLFKLLVAGLRYQEAQAPGRTRVLTDDLNFPSDLYVAQGAIDLLGGRHTLAVLPSPDGIHGPVTALAEALAGAPGETVALVTLSHTVFKSGYTYDMREITRLAHAAGALVLWDLSHSAGAVPVELNAAGVDLAVGCCYKYLNGGPGAPAFVWAHPKHVDRVWQPLAGWWGHAAPFAFTPDYQPAAGITRFQCGTQPIVSLSALDCALDVFAEADKLGGMAALRTKSLALTDLFIELVEQLCPGQFSLVTPREHARRGSQVCLTPTDQLPKGSAYAICQALIARGVVGDFRAGDAQQPDILRLGFTPLYLSYENVLQAAQHLRDVLQNKEYAEPRFNQRHAVT